MSAAQQPGSDPAGEVPVSATARQTAFPRIRSPDPAWRGCQSLASRVVNHLWPWTRHNYPGLREGVYLTLGRTLAWPTVYPWLRGQVEVPDWALAAFEAETRARALEGLCLADELAAYRASQARRLRHQPGKLRRGGRVTDD